MGASDLSRISDFEFRISFGFRASPFGFDLRLCLASSCCHRPNAMNHPGSRDALGLLETHGLTPAMVAIDAMLKAASVRVIQLELNDLCGVSVQLAGPTADVQTAIAIGYEVAAAMAGNPVTHLIPRPATAAEPGIRSRPEYNPLIQQEVVFTLPDAGASTATGQAQEALHHHTLMTDHPPSALGFIETQGFTAVMEALDTACKAADVTVVGKEKLGGGFVTVVIQGELSAVTAAIEAAKLHVEGLGKLIAAHVIARPADAILSLLPATPGASASGR